MTIPFTPNDDATALSLDVRTRKRSAREVTVAALETIRRQDSNLNCFTMVLETEALAQADAIDGRIATGDDPGPLAGVPFAVKNLFDISGQTTIAGSKIHAEKPAADRDATVVERLKGAGAVLLGALNMDEYAYGFTTENTHYGPTRNPHDLTRVAGGSSGGSAAAVAAGMVPLTVGSDTNGSIRVPAALCGVYGLKPTYGRISRAGAFLLPRALITSVHLPVRCVTSPLLSILCTVPTHGTLSRASGLPNLCYRNWSSGRTVCGSP